jgi:hypothetical protein
VDLANLGSETETCVGSHVLLVVVISFEKNFYWLPFTPPLWFAVSVLRPRAPEIEENRNAKQCRNWICARVGEMAAKREMTMSAGEGPSGGGVNQMPETRVVDSILSDSDKGPSSGKEQRAGEGAVKWARGLPHVCEHKCLATTKRCRGSSEEGVEDFISNSGNDHDDGEASFSESHSLFTCSLDGS